MLLLAPSLDKLTTTTEVLPFFQALCGVEGLLIALFFGLWQAAVAARWQDREKQRERLERVLDKFGGQKDGSRGGDE